MSRLTMPTFEELTPDQDRILRLPDEGRYLVFGPPGSGKTVIALMRAIAMRARGNQPVTIMFNRLLSLYCRQMLGQDGSYTQVYTYHQWFLRHYGSVYGGLPPERLDDKGKLIKFRYDWDKIITVCARQGTPRTDGTPLLIDEGQDLPRPFYEYLSLHFPNIMVFADENQMLDDQENSILKDICDQLGITSKIDPRTNTIQPDTEHSFLLRDNMRNTIQVAKVAGHFYPGTQTGIPDLPKHDGPKPYLIDYGDLSYFADRIVRHARIHPHYLVAVITADNGSWSELSKLIEPLCLKHRLRFDCYSSLVRKAIDFNRPGIALLNLQSMKGLEFDSVLLADLHKHIVRSNSSEHKMRLYVASSRPRERLYLFHDRRQQTPILDEMPGEELLSRYSLKR